MMPSLVPAWKVSGKAPTINLPVSRKLFKLGGAKICSFSFDTLKPVVFREESNATLPPVLDDSFLSKADNIEDVHCFANSPISDGSSTPSPHIQTPSSACSLSAHFKRFSAEIGDTEVADVAVAKSYKGPSSRARLASRALLSIVDAMDLPYVRSVIELATLILDAIEGASENKRHCSKIIQKIRRLLGALEKSLGEVPPLKLEIQVKELKSCFEDVLHMLHPLRERKTALRCFFYQEDEKILRECNDELEEAYKSFMLQSAIDTQCKIDSLVKAKELKTGELDATTEEECLNTENKLDFLVNVPVVPEVFVGHDRELSSLVALLSCAHSVKVAITGEGGIGKTTLITKALHHDSVAQIYGAHRYFIRCDSATSAEGLINIISSSLGLSSTAQKTDRLRDVLRSLSSVLKVDSGRLARVLIVLDNFESPWESQHQQKEVEDLLGRLAALENLTIVITMRGTERPRNVKWDRLPGCNLHGLSALDRHSARSLFLEVSGLEEYSAHSDSAEEDGLDELIKACDYIPLPINLMARLVADGLETVPDLLRRRSGMLPLLATGNHATDNMTVSIQLSINSHRVKSYPGSLALLDIIAMLPNGISEDQLRASAAVDYIQDFDRCKHALLRTSLIHRGKCDRFLMHSLIRSYVIDNSSGESIDATRALATYFWDMLKRAWKDGHDVAFEGSFCATGIREVSPELGNIESLTRYILKAKHHHDPNTIGGAIEAAIALATLNFQTSLGTSSLITDFLVDIEKHGNKKLIADSLYRKAATSVRFHANVKDLVQRARPSDSLQRALLLYSELGDKLGQAECYRQLSDVAYVERNFDRNLDLLEKARMKHDDVGNRELQAMTLISMARTHRVTGNSSLALEELNDANLFLEGTDAPQTRVQCLESLGKGYLSPLCDYVKAMGCFQEALNVCDAWDFRETRLYANSSVLKGEVMLTLSRLSEAREIFSEAGAIYRKAQIHDREAYALVLHGLAHLETGFERDAHRILEAVLVKWKKVGNTWGEAIATRALARLASFEEDYVSAVRLYNEALEKLRKDSDKWILDISECLLGLGSAYLRGGKRDLALTKLHEAQRAFKDLGNPRGQVDCERYLCELDAMVDEGDTSKRAIGTRLEDVQERYRTLGLHKEADECRIFLLSLSQQSRRGPMLRIDTQSRYT